MKEVASKLSRDKEQRQNDQGNLEISVVFDNKVRDPVLVGCS